MKTIEEIYRERLRLLIKEAGSQANLSKLINKSGPQISQWLNASPDSKTGKPRVLSREIARQIEASLGKPNGWMDQVVDEGAPVASLEEGEPLGDDYIQIRESEVRFAAGNGRTPLFDEVAASVPRTYRRDWFIKEGINPEHARCFKVHGDSMESFLFDGDSVLVNLAEKEIVNGKVYALRYGEELRIKRVYKKLDGGLILHSDNPNHKPVDEDVSPSLAQESISIIGRVRDKSGTGGL